MKPHETIRYVFHNLLRNILIVLGHNFLQMDGFKPTPYTYFLYLTNVFALMSCIYTVMWYDISTGLNSFGYGAANIQVI